MYRRKASPTLNITLHDIKVCVEILCLFNVCTLHLLTTGGEFPDPYQIMKYHVLYGVELIYDIVQQRNRLKYKQQSIVIYGMIQQRNRLKYKQLSVIIYDMMQHRNRLKYKQLSIII